MVVSTGVVTTLAGAAGMFGGTDGTGNAARFNFPAGVAWDGAGNLYVADTYNFSIRKVVVSTGAVTTLASRAGGLGYSDGTGAAARFNYPTGVAWDGAGDLYVADSKNFAIRKVVVSSGAVTTFAGQALRYGRADGTGSGAQFSTPQGAAADGAGNLYVADSGNNTIRQVVLSTGVVTTLAGSTAGLAGGSDGTGTSARFSSPGGLAMDGAGNLYVADSGNSTIRQMVLSTSVVTTIAGNSGQVGSADGAGFTARFYSPTAVTVDGAGNLYVADNGNSTIRKVVIATGVVTTIAGTAGMVGSADGTGAAARFFNPSGVVWDGAGNLYITDSINNTIRKMVVSTGVVTTIAGTAATTGSADGTGAAARFRVPQSVALDNAGNLYVVDAYNFTLRKIMLSTGSVSTIIGVPGRMGVKLGLLPARLNMPTAVTAAPDGTLIVLDRNENAVLAAR